METKRIVMTTTFFPPYHLGGDAIHVSMLTDELLRRKHEVTIIHSVDAYALKRGKLASIDRPIDKEGLTVVPLRSAYGRASPMMTYLTGRNRLAERALEEVVTKSKPDFIHHHNISLLGDNILKIGKKIPSIYTAHDYWLICPRSDLMYRGKESCQRMRCTRCSIASRRPPQFWRNSEFRDEYSSLGSIISPSDFLADRLRFFLGMDSQVLPNFTPRIQIPSAPETNQDYFIYIGVLERHKGLELALRAFQSGRIRSKLIVIGKGTLEGTVRSAAREMPNRVEYRGFLKDEDKIALLSGAKALLAPSIWNENSPLTCIEALSLGIPLVVTNFGGLPELVSKEKCGLIAEATSEGLESSISVLENDEPQRKAMSRNALISYEKYHTPELYLKRYLDLVGRVEAA